MDTFATRLKLLRGERNSKEFAQGIGVSAGSLSAYENGASMPSSRLISRISEKTGVSVEWLLHGTGPGPFEPHAQKIPAAGGDTPLHHTERIGHEKNSLPTVGTSLPSAEFADTIRHLQSLLQTQQTQIQAQFAQIATLNSENRMLLREIAELREERGAYRVERELHRERIEHLEAELTREHAREHEPARRQPIRLGTDYAADRTTPELRDSSAPDNDSIWPYAPLGDSGYGNIHEVSGGGKDGK